MLSPATLPLIQAALRELGVDGWLLYDFRGTNPIAAGLLPFPPNVLLTRRVFALISRDGVPRALSHAIEDDPWKNWPAEWPRERYSSWRALEQQLGELVRGKTVAMEYSAGDAVPYLDRIPAG